MEISRIFYSILMLAAACGSPGKNETTVPPNDSGARAVDADFSGASATGFVTYVANDSIWRISAARNSTPINVTEALNALAPGKEETPAVSRNGAFMTVNTNRFDPACSGYSCIAIVKGDLSAAEIVQVAGQPIHPKGHAAISNDGNLIVYPGDDGPHAVDLYAIRREQGSWSAPVLLTGNSTHQYNEQVVLSPDDNTALFNCGPVPYASNGTGACEVDVQGLGFRQVIDPAKHPTGQSGEFVAKNADYALDGGLVFEADWLGEQLWYLAPGSDRPSLVIEREANDNSPCTLPGGYYASLWLGRPEGTGIHELKITAPDGSDSYVLTPGVDVLDIDVMCHE